MKTIFALFLSLTVLVSCSHENPNNKTSKTNNTSQNNYKADGEEVISTFPNGAQKLVQSYVITNGQRVVIYEKENFENGNISKEGGIKNEKRHGLWKSFRPDGLLWSEGNFEEGLRDGIAKTYHPSGKKYYDGFYTKGKKSGLWKFYDEVGLLVKEVDYENK